MASDWSIQEVARLAGTTSRTLRHYDDVGLLRPSRVAQNGYRYYDRAALRRLQRILLLRDLGLGIPAITEVLAGRTDDVAALRTHLDYLHTEQERLERQIASVERTIAAAEPTAGPSHEGEELMAKDMLDGFDHTKYRDEVVERWGEQAWQDGDNWWRSLSDDQRQAFGAEHRTIAADYAAVQAAGTAPESPAVQAIVRRHYEWIAMGWQGRHPTAEQFLGLADMYVADDRFAANYGGTEGAEYVREAFRAYAAGSLA